MRTLTFSADDKAMFKRLSAVLKDRADLLKPRKRMEPTLRPCCVVWTDAEFNSGWKSRREIEEYLNEDLPEVETLGWLAYRGPDFVLVMLSAGTYKSADMIKIPTGMIKSIHSLGEKE